MHIPDGYLAPAFSLGLGIATVPAWAAAVARVKTVLTTRTVPLMAIFSAFIFTIMMFNVPVPGGTTAHGVGGTLAAIVLGPWAAVIIVSAALIIQALFFGDGGVLAIFANCFNMAVALPFTGYFVYRLLSARAPLLSNRRIWAAGIAGYAGITVAGLLVGVELGVQPMLFNDNGRPLYSPYGLSAAIPAMLLAHMLGASIVEGIITAFVFRYIQQSHPEYLTSLQAVVGGEDVETGTVARRPIWQLAAVGTAIGAPILLVAGLVTGGGDFGRLFGADWSKVDWAGVGSMLILSLVIAALLIPAVRLLLPARMRGIGIAYAVIAVLLPLGLIAPGFAFGEGSADDVQAEFGYVPEGLQSLSSIFSAPLKNYNLPLPFFTADKAPMWHAAVGYEIAGVIGALVLGAVTFGLAALLRRRGGMLEGPTIEESTA